MHLEVTVIKIPRQGHDKVQLLFKIKYQRIFLWNSSSKGLKSVNWSNKSKH